MSNFTVQCGACARRYDSRLNMACPYCIGDVQPALPMSPADAKPAKPVDKSAASFAAPFLDGRKKARPK